MRRLIVLFFLPLLVFSAPRIELYGEYSPEWELPDTGSGSLPVFSAHIKGSLKGMSCGWQATAFYQLAMMLNTDNLQQIIDNWKSLAFPLALYTVATYFPVVKEALVGAEYISDIIASLANMNCQAAMKMIQAYNKKTSNIVRACVLKRLGKNINIWTATPSQIQKALSDVSEAEIRKAYDYCMNHASLLDALPLPDVKKWLKKLNPRKWIACNYVKAFGLKDLGKEYNADKKILVEGGSLETVAKLYLLAITPEFIIDERTKQVLLKPIYLTDKGKKEPVNLVTVGKVIDEKIDRDFKHLEEVLKGGASLEEFISEVEKLNDKYYVKNTDDLLAFFRLWYYAYKRYEQAKKAGDDYFALRIKTSLKTYERALKKQYSNWAKRNMLQYALDYLSKVEAMAKNQQITGALSCPGD